MAKKIGLDELKKLPPEKQIEILKKFEEKRKKDIEKAEDLIKASEEELKDKEKTKIEIEEKSKELLEEKLSDEEDKELENIVKEANKGAEDAELAHHYGKALEEVYEIANPATYDRVRELRDRAASGNLSEQERRSIDFYSSQFNQVSTVEAAYIKNEETRIDVMKIKTALEQIEQYKR